ncbi:hypothetical protein P7L68_13575 [Tistrella mobilis]|jgi:hypothetical protein|uniref:hypothetical protein n=1 Tax=Tistrella mobilis TaxID=171437 RepID=UPI0035566329
MTPDQGDDDRETGLGDIQNPVAALDAIAAEISVAREMLARGDAVNLHSMEVRVTRFCAHLASLPPGSGQAIRSRMLGLIDALNVLEREMRQVFDETAREMGGFSARQRATAAYGRTGNR